MPGPTAYRFGFNSKERDDDIKGDGNSIAFEARIYDPRLGKFLSIDPLTARYPWNTPYSYAENKVINGIDIEGKKWGFFMPSITSCQMAWISVRTQESIKKGSSPRDAYISATLEVGLINLAAIAIPVAAWWAIRNPWKVLRFAAETVLQELTNIPIISNPLELLEGATQRGLFKGTWKGMQSWERQRAAEYIADGSKLERIEVGTGKTADFVVDGKKIEFKSLQGSTLNENTAVTRLQEATKKEGVQIIDLDIRAPGGSEKDAKGIFERFKGTQQGKAFKGEVRIATHDGLLKYKNK